MLGDCLGRTGPSGTQPWEVVHSQMSVKAGGTGCRWRTEDGRGQERGLERSQGKVRLLQRGGHWMNILSIGH